MKFLTISNYECDHNAEDRRNHRDLLVSKPHKPQKSNGLTGSSIRVALQAEIYSIGKEYGNHTMFLQLGMVNTAGKPIHRRHNACHGGFCYALKSANINKRKY